MESKMFFRGSHGSKFAKISTTGKIHDKSGILQASFTVDEYVLPRFEVSFELQLEWEISAGLVVVQKYGHQFIYN